MAGVQENGRFARAVTAWWTPDKSALGKPHTLPEVICPIASVCENARPRETKRAAMTSVTTNPQKNTLKIRLPLNRWIWQGIAARLSWLPESRAIDAQAGAA